MLVCLAEYIAVLLVILKLYTPSTFTIVVVGQQALVHYSLLGLFMLKGALINDYFD
jgi:hypothetical protein